MELFLLCHHLWQRKSCPLFLQPVPLFILKTQSKWVLFCLVSLRESKRKLSKLLEYVACLVHLAVLGILGSFFCLYLPLMLSYVVTQFLTRYGLQKLFGPENAGVMSNETILYPDLPSNVVGSFLMEWWGVVFKGDISDYIIIGLTTRYLGSRSFQRMESEYVGSQRRRPLALCNPWFPNRLVSGGLLHNLRNRDSRGLPMDSQKKKHKLQLVVLESGQLQAPHSRNGGVFTDADSTMERQWDSARERYQQQGGRGRGAVGGFC